MRRVEQKSDSLTSLRNLAALYGSSYFMHNKTRTLEGYKKVLLNMIEMV